MDKRLRVFYRGYGLVLLLLSVSFHTRGQDDASDFERDFLRAVDFPYSKGDPAAIRHKIELYEGVLETYPDHPRINKAKFFFYRFLKATDVPANVERGMRILAEVVDASDLSTREGQNIALEYAECILRRAFSYKYTYGKETPDLTRTKRVLDTMRDLYQSSQDRLLDLRVECQIGLLTAVEQDPVSGVTYLLDTMERAFDWHDEDNYWIELFKSNRVLYRKLVDEVASLAGTVAEISQWTSDPDDIVRLVMEHKRAHNFLEPLIRRYEKKQEKKLRSVTDKIEKEIISDLGISKITVAAKSPKPVETPPPSSETPAPKPIEKAPRQETPPAQKGIWPYILAVGLATILLAAGVWALKRQGRRKRTTQTSDPTPPERPGSHLKE